MPTAASWRRRGGPALLLLLLAGGLFLGFQPRPIEVDVGAARRAPLEVTVEQEGRTRVVDRYVVTAPVNGYARRIVLDVGDAVGRGATLVELEPARADVLDPRRRAEAEARVAASSASVSAAIQRADAAESNASFAEKELKRLRALQPSGYVAIAALDRAVSDAERSAAELRSARFAVATARHERDAALTALRYAASGGDAEPVAVRSPVDGRVLRITRKSEGPVAAGQPLIEIGDPRALEVEVDVLSADAVRMHPGTRVRFERWGGEGVLEGVVRVVEPAGFTKISALGVEEQRVWIIVAFTAPAERWQRLGDSYRVEASFILWAGQEVLQIPASALFSDGDGWATFVIEEGRAVRRRLQVGQRSGLQAQVLAGIREGEKVIVHPDDRIRDGVRVAAGAR